MCLNRTCVACAASCSDVCVCVRLAALLLMCHVAADVACLFCCLCVVSCVAGRICL